MISHARRVIFIHVPKAAGTSVESVLGHHGPDGIARGMQDHRTLRQLMWPYGGVEQFTSAANVREAARAIKARVQPPEHAANRTTVSRAQFHAYFKFAVVRNPWARAYSCYRNVLADDLHRARLGVRPDATFAGFVEACAGTDLLQPQTYWLIDYRGRIGLDQLCRFESLAADFAQVCRRAGLPDTPLPRLNVGGDGAYVDVCDDRTRRLIADRYRDEIEAFGYTFDGTVGRVSGAAGT